MNVCNTFLYLFCFFVFAYQPVVQIILSILFLFCFIFILFLFCFLVGKKMNSNQPNNTIIINIANIANNKKKNPIRITFYLAI